MKQRDIFALLNLGMAVIKDAAVIQCLKRIEKSQREFLIAEADQNRIRSKVVIVSISKLDFQIKDLEMEYARVKPLLGEKGEEIIDLILKELYDERARLVKEKNQIAKSN